MYVCGNAAVETHWYTDKKTIPLAAYENMQTLHCYLMGNTIESYRAAIGSFYSVTHRLILYVEELQD